MPSTPPANFTRDPGAAATLAAQFGAGAGTAEQLIEANTLRFSQELLTANALPKDDEKTKEMSPGDVASAAGLEEEQILDFAVRGRYVTFVAADEQGRPYKDALLLKGDSIEAPDPAQMSPDRARIAAAVQAQRMIDEAKKEASEIVAKAETEARTMLNERAVAAAEESQEPVRQMAEEQAKAVEDADTVKEAEEAGAPKEADSDERPPEGPKQQKRAPGQQRGRGPSGE